MSFESTTIERINSSVSIASNNSNVSTQDPTSVPKKKRGMKSLYGLLGPKKQSKDIVQKVEINSQISTEVETPPKIEEPVETKNIVVVKESDKSKFHGFIKITSDVRSVTHAICIWCGI